MITKKYAEQKKEMTIRNILASGINFQGYKH